MYREHLFGMLRIYAERYPGERATIDRMREFVSRHKDCFLRTCRRGHVTASAWVVSHDAEQFLLGHHKKLDRWLQLGGHADGEPEAHRVALREAQEESGIYGLQLVWPSSGEHPADIDIHKIPATGGEPAHDHHDLRFVLRAPAGARPRASDESHDVRWFACADLERVVTEKSLLRLAHKARRLL